MFGPSDKLTIPFRFVSFHFVSRFYSGYYNLPIKPEWFTNAGKLFAPGVQFCPSKHFSAYSFQFYRSLLFESERAGW